MLADGLIVWWRIEQTHVNGRGGGDGDGAYGFGGEVVVQQGALEQECPIVIPADLTRGRPFHVEG